MNILQMKKTSFGPDMQQTLRVVFLNSAEAGGFRINPVSCIFYSIKRIFQFSLKKMNKDLFANYWICDTLRILIGITAQD